MKLNVGNGFHLSSVRETDKDAYLKHLDDGGEISSCTPLISYPYTDEAANWWIKHRLEFMAQRGTEISFAIRNPKEMLIGTIGLDDFEIGETHRAEVNFWLAREYRRQGIATNALRVFVPYAFAQLKIIRITAYTLDFNTPATRVLEKNGFRLEGCLRKHTRTRSGLFDTLVYGLLKEDSSVITDL